MIRRLTYIDVTIVEVDRSTLQAIERPDKVPI